MRCALNIKILNSFNFLIGLTQMKIFCSKQIYKLIKWFSRGVFISDVCSRFFFHGEIWGYTYNRGCRKKKMRVKDLNTTLIMHE